MATPGIFPSLADTAAIVELPPPVAHEDDLTRVERTCHHSAHDLAFEQAQIIKQFGEKACFFDWSLPSDRKPYWCLTATIDLEVVEPPPRKLVRVGAEDPYGFGW